MDSPDVGSPKLNTPEDSKDAVSIIIATDKEAFKEYSADPNNKRRLNLPKTALRYMVIPPRILELVDDPTRVDLHLTEIATDKVGAIVVEHRAAPITDMNSRRKYLAEKDEFYKREKAKAGNPIVFMIPKTGGPSLPADVDPYHVNDKYLKLVESGVFSPNDFFINNIQLLAKDINPQVLYVADYRIRESLQRQGIGSSFYTRLRECAKDLGFRFVTGQNFENGNITYFRDKLGRSTLDQVKPEKRGEFSDTAKPDKNTTIDFLYPEDKAAYIQ